MTSDLSTNTQAILLLTAPLIAGGGVADADLLKPAEYKKFVRRLLELQRQPSDLFSSDSDEILRLCHPEFDQGRLKRLLGRGFLLSQAVERWAARAIWVLSRADTDYPRCFKARLRDDAPAVLYGCGNRALLDKGGLAVVGSREVGDSLTEYTLAVGRLSAQAAVTVISGGARGVDQAAVRGATDAGGTACCVLPGDLEKASMNRENRNLLLDGRLALVSPYDPNVRFENWRAMQRNKLIYALADASLVVESGIGSKSGTWSGASEQLKKFRFAPVFIRATGDASSGLEDLRHLGALPWPCPQDAESFHMVFSMENDASADVQAAFPLPADGDEHPFRAEVAPAPGFLQAEEAPRDALDSAATKGAIADAGQATTESAEKAPLSPVAEGILDVDSECSSSLTAPDEVLFITVRAVLQDLLSMPMEVNDVAVALGVRKDQAKDWLERLVEEGMLDRRSKKPASYVIKAPQLGL